MSVKIAPSILAADFSNLERDIKYINESKADWFHLDIMDGVFVPNISFEARRGQQILSADRAKGLRPNTPHHDGLYRGPGSTAFDPSPRIPLSNPA